MDWKIVTDLLQQATDLDRIKELLPLIEKAATAFKKLKKKKLDKNQQALADRLCNEVIEALLLAKDIDDETFEEKLDDLRSFEARGIKPKDIGTAYRLVSSRNGSYYGRATHGYVLPTKAAKKAAKKAPARRTAKKAAKKAPARKAPRKSAR